MKLWAAALLLHALVITTGQVSYQTASAINDYVWMISAALAAISCFRAAMTQHGRDRMAWLLFSSACACWTLGQVVWNVYELVLRVPLPVPSYADVGYLAFGPLMIMGLFALRATQGERRMTWLRVANLGLILCTLAAVLITAFTEPLMQTQRVAWASLVVFAENVFISLAFIIGVYFLWSYHWGDRLLSYGLVTLSLGVQMIAGLLYARGLIIDGYGATSMFNVGWPLAFALHQWGAEAQVSLKTRGREDSDRMRRSQGWVDAVVPAVLLLCIAISAVLVAHEISARTIQWRTVVFVAFAIILALREAWLYWQGQQLRGALESSAQALARARQRLHEVNVERTDLERLIEVTARAGGVGLWEWNLQTNAVRYSRQFKRQLGYEEHELPDDVEQWRSRLHPEEMLRVMAELEAYLSDPQGELVIEHRLRHRDGSYRWMLARGSVSRDSAGRPARMMGSMVDITNFKQLEQSLRESEGRYRDLADVLESRVAQRMRELSDAYRESQNFAYAVAHDLKAPLRAIDGFSALLEQSAHDRLTDAEREYVVRARQGALRMARLIDDLLDYSRVEHREQRLGPVDCRSFVEELVTAMTPQIQEARAQVSLAVDSTPVLADTEGLRIVLTNLLQNALKFSRANPHPHIVIEAHAESGRYILAVRDNGIGFEPAYRDKIFEIFNRLHTSGYEGTGIGLALVRKAVKRMGGEVWTESTPGQGASFFVALNLATAGATQEEGCATAPPLARQQ